MAEKGITRDELEVVKTEMLNALGAKIDAGFAKLARFQKSEELEAWQDQLLVREQNVAAREMAVQAAEAQVKESVGYWEAVKANIAMNEATIAEQEERSATLSNMKEALHKDIAQMKEVIRLMRAELHEVSREPD
jgi:DNA repair ATPase RecN